MADLRTALFVIDVQGDLATNPDTRIPHAERIAAAGQEIVQGARRVLDHAPRADAVGLDPLPSLIVVVQHEEDASSGALVRGSEAWGAVFPARPASPRERLVAKTLRDTFESNPTLADELRVAGIGHIVAFGIQSECCVLSTCQGALDAGFQVTLLAGAHSTYDSGGNTAVDWEQLVEEKLAERGATIVPWETAVQSWVL